MTHKLTTRFKTRKTLNVILKPYNKLSGRTVFNQLDAKVRIKLNRNITSTKPAIPASVKIKFLSVPSEEIASIRICEVKTIRKRSIAGLRYLPHNVSKNSALVMFVDVS